MSAAEQVVEQFNEIVKPEGGSVVLVSTDDGVLRVRYAPGQNEECASCVMTPDALAAMMKDMAQTLDPSIQEVEVQA
ncbi:MAG: hypothetical protein CL908_24215 [Deltaproteobacteria bacterium]|jgi:Fe-S cluster biogenesis protein NfuA|nr:hypothetical protein [Deltaproteobacteria bacterium]